MSDESESASGNEDLGDFRSVLFTHKLGRYERAAIDRHSGVRLISLEQMVMRLFHIHTRVGIEGSVRPDFDDLVAKHQVPDLIA